MADDGDAPNKPKSCSRPQEAFRRAQETQVEHRFPNHTTGIVAVPRGSRGPKGLYLKRIGDSFGFTLRHFIVYPPDSVAENDDRHAAVGALSAPMDTIFVKQVKVGGAAHLAGLRCGDRLVGVNRVSVTDKSYSQVVQLIQNSPDYLLLFVVPKEDDILQRYFAETAYNPASNQITAVPNNDRQRAQSFLAHTLNQPHQPGEVQLDAISWRSLQNYPGSNNSGSCGYDRGQKSAENLDCYREEARPQVPQRHKEAVKIRPNEPNRRGVARARPQVADSGRNMGRRASDGCSLYDREPYADFSTINSDPVMVVNNSKVFKASYPPDGGQNSEMPALRSYPNSAGCRLSLDGGRRESASSLASSLADGSKDSLTSYDSSSTITGHETDDSAIMTRYRKSFQQKEEFLKMSSGDPALIQREFYSRPKKLDRAMWPPTEVPKQDSPSKNSAPKPTHQHFQRVKNDIENERDLLLQSQNSGGTANIPQQKGAKTPKNKTNVPNLDKIKEGSTPPNLDNMEQLNGSNFLEDDVFAERCYPERPQMVFKRARQFETGKAQPEDDPLLGDRTSFYRSELARISSKRVVPNVTERAQEFEFRSNEPKTAGKKIQRDSRSLESTDMSENEAIKVRARSNSAESWVAALQSDKKISRQDAIIGDSKDRHQAVDSARTDLPSSLIPVPVEHMHFAPAVSITPAPTIIPLSPKAARPNQLDLEGPVRPSRHLKPPSSGVETPIRRPVSPSAIGGDNKPVVVKRRTKNTNLAEDERIMRRESYLKATEGGRVHFDSDLSDGDVSPHALRSGSVSGSSSSSLDREREKSSASPSEKHAIIREGALHCKITEIDGKRFGDRSWKQIWACLRGPKLYLHKDRHHQSPIGTSDVVEQSLAGGVDMRASVVRVAEDYTKRKHVLRVSSVKPCRSEFLLQADNTEELADWVKALQEQMATTTDVEAKLDLSGSKQQAVPQTVPASTTIQVQGSRLSPQPAKSKSSSTRNRSPTGQSPVSKTRKPSQAGEPSTSPKSKTWRGRVAQQFRKMQGASSPSSPTAPEGSTFGIPLDHCIASSSNPYVPRFVEVCTGIVDARGLHTIGIYRVPGNNASITALTEEVNRTYDHVPVDDPKWNDIHVVSSLLKSYFRKMPDSLVTDALYASFIEADKSTDPEWRINELRRLVKSLPPHNYHTLKHIVLHLRNVVRHAKFNKMEAKNLAIVFGPTIVRPEEDTLENMVNNMTHQCKIVETLLICAEWFFSEDDTCNLNLAAIPDAHEESEPVNNQALLLENISKYEALKDKEKNGALFSSIISAAQRKVKRKSTKGTCSSNETKEEVTSPNGTGSYTSRPYPLTDLKESTTIDGKSGVIPTTVTDIEKINKMKRDKQPWFNYSTDQEDFHRRIENFELETKAMLEMPRVLEISVAKTTADKLSSSAGNVNQTRLLAKPVDAQLLKTHSASNVFARTSTNNKDNSRNSLDNPYAVQYANKNSDRNSDYGSLRYSNLQQYTGDSNRNVGQAGGGGKGGDRRNGRVTMRRGSSVENINSSSMDLNANGTMKKVKYENEGDGLPRTGSLDSLNKMAAIDDGIDLVASLTKLYDEKLWEKKHSQVNVLAGDDLPYVDESPERVSRAPSIRSDKGNLGDVYRNPSLHKNHYSKELKKDMEKDEDSTMARTNVPDNERRISTHPKLTPIYNNTNCPKLKRSESLNKPERTAASPLKVKRSESLNKTGDKLKRSDSLTKNEKTESNLNKRREIATSVRRTKDGGKLKRKNGMPDRKIKRRHTVGGTKDPDKVTWLDNKNQEEVSSNKENKEKNLRTSSPDLSSTRRERLFFEIFGPENMVKALRQHLIGARPQSFPESALFKVPLESHV